MSDIDWFPLEPGRYLKNTLHLTTRQHGAYWLLIMAAFENRGYLPGTDQALAAIAKLTAKEWREDGETLKAFLTRDGDRWIHEFAKHQREDAEARVAAKASAGRKGAHKRWNGRGNGGAMAAPSNSQWQTDAQRQEQVQEQPPALKIPCVADSAPAGASASGRARLIAEDWNPTDADIAHLRKSRPDLTGAYFDERMNAFRLWCKSKAVWTHDEASTWLQFMLGSYVRDEQGGGKRKGPTGHADLPPAEPWEKRVSDFRKDGFWIAGWGPKPGEAGCRAPSNLLRSAA